MVLAQRCRRLESGQQPIEAEVAKRHYCARTEEPAAEAQGLLGFPHGGTDVGRALADAPVPNRNVGGAPDLRGPLQIMGQPGEVLGPAAEGNQGNPHAAPFSNQRGQPPAAQASIPRRPDGRRLSGRG